MAPDSPEAFATISGAFDANSTAMLNKISEYVAQLNNFSFDASVYVKRLYSGQEVEESARYQFVFQRPNLLSMSMKLSDEHLTLIADGRNIMFVLDSLRMCKIQEQPADLGVLVGWLTQQPAFRRLFSRRLAEGWTENVKHTNCSEDMLDGIPCDRFEMTFERTDLVIWFRKGEEPIPMRLTADLSATFNSPEGTFVTRIEWENWNTTQMPSPDTFTVRVPEHFAEVKAFDTKEESGRRGNEVMDQSLIGEQVPPFVLELLDNNVTTLADHLGKNAVVLEFWATWCRPCKNALISMATQSKSFPKDDIKFYAVNLMESRGEVASFVEKMGMKMVVALDTTGKLAEQLHLEAVPSSVLIGKDGSIQAIHVGGGRGLARQIENELHALAKGDTLAKNIKLPSASKQLHYRLELDSESYCVVFVGY